MTGRRGWGEGQVNKATPVQSGRTPPQHLEAQARLAVADKVDPAVVDVEARMPGPQVIARAFFEEHGRPARFGIEMFLKETL